MEHCPNSAPSDTVRGRRDLDEGLASKCLSNSEEVSMEWTSIGLITSNYFLQAQLKEGPSSTSAFILCIMSEQRHKSFSYRVFGSF